MNEHLGTFILQFVIRGESLSLVHPCLFVRQSVSQLVSPTQPVKPKRGFRLSSILDGLVFVFLLYTPPLKLNLPQKICIFQIIFHCVQLTKIDTFTHFQQIPLGPFREIHHFSCYTKLVLFLLVTPINFIKETKDADTPLCYLETEVKYCLESLQGTQTEKLDPILSLLVPHTRSQGSYQVTLGLNQPF